jgi:putative ABC transport system permease protein
MMTRLKLFTRLFIWFSVRYLRKHRGRALTVLLGIALGASVFTSVRLSVHASLTTFSRSMDLISGYADWVVAQPGGRVPETLVAKLIELPSIRSASPVLTAYVRPSRQDQNPFLLIGIDPVLDRPLRGWRVNAQDGQDIGMWLRLLTEPGTLVMAEPLAAHLGVSSEDRLALEYVNRKQAFIVLGTLEPEGIASFEGGRIGITDIATFQEFTGIYGKVDRIDLLLEPFTSEHDLDRIRALLPAGIQLKPPSESKESGRRLIQAYQLNLSILSFVSLFVGMFLVYSLVALNAASRRREIAILVAVGASPRTIFLLFLFEGALFGIIGWMVAIPITTLLVKYMLHGVSQTISTLFVRVQLESIVLSGWEILISFLVTAAVSVLAAFQPAREAMRVPPKEAMSVSSDRKTYQKTSAMQFKTGILFVLIALPLSKMPGLAGFPLPGYLAILLIVVGFSLMAPWALHHTGGRVSSIFRRIAGEPAFLASRYVRDSGTRTAISVGALITAVALFASLVVMIYSFRQTVALWVTQSIKGDLFIRPKMADFNQYRDTFSPTLVDALEHLETKVDIETSRRFYLLYGKDPYQFETMDFEVFFRHGDFLYVQGNPKTVRLKLLSGKGLVVSEVFASKTGLSVGDRFRATIQSKTWDLPIVGIIRDYRTDGGVVFYSIHHFMNQSQDKGINGARFFFRNPPEDLNRAVARLTREIIEVGEDSVEFYSGNALRKDILKVFDETFAVTTVLLLIALVVAALGIATTLTVLVLERSRQLNTLFAVGASFRQIRAMIFWEAALMIVAGEIAGLICGFFLSYLLVFVINKESFGWTFHYGVNWAVLSLSLPLIFVTALLSALPATQMVFREPPATVLKQ